MEGGAWHILPVQAAQSCAALAEARVIAQLTARDSEIHWLTGDLISPNDRWHVLHTKSWQERALADTLGAMRISHFLPLVRQSRYHGKRKVISDIPLFPGYVFVLGSLDETYEADRTKRVARIIPVADQEQLDGELRNLHLALARDAELVPYPFLKQGMRVEVRAGPFRGLQGVIESRAQAHRLILKVEMLGTAATMQIDAALLDPVS
jgi:transcriptional antiterminator RfaH